MADGEENLLGEDQLAANMQAAGQQQQGAGQQPAPGAGPAGQGQQQQAQGQQQQAQGVPADLQALALAQGHEQAMNEAVARIRALNQQLADRGDDSVLGAIDLTAAGAINQWSNAPSDQETAEDWLESVNTVKGIKTWSDVQTLKAMVFNLRGEACLLYTSPSPRDLSTSRMPSSA